MTRSVGGTTASGTPGYCSPAAPNAPASLLWLAAARFGTLDRHKIGPGAAQGFLDADHGRRQGVRFSSFDLLNDTRM